MLSHHEDRQLRAIEQWFEESDPGLTRMLSEHEYPKSPHRRRAARFAVDVTGGGLFLLGALAAAPFLVVVGVLLISTGVCLHVAAR